VSRIKYVDEVRKERRRECMEKAREESRREWKG